MKRAIIAALVSFVLTGLSTAVWADAPNLLTYQGRLTEGVPALPVTGNRTIDLQICTDPGGTACASTGSQSVSVSNGLFRSTFTVPASVNLGINPKYLKILVNGTALSPLEQLTSSPYAVIASSASELVGTGGTAKVSGSLIIPLNSLGVGVSAPISVGFPGATTVGHIKGQAGTPGILRLQGGGTGFGGLLEVAESENLAFRVGGSEKMALTSAGNLGIGTSASAGTGNPVVAVGPSGRLYEENNGQTILSRNLYSDTNQKKYLTAGTARALIMDGSALSYQEYASGAVGNNVSGIVSPLIANANGVYLFGNTGIGTSNPLSRLDVHDGDIRITSTTSTGFQGGIQFLDGSRMTSASGAGAWVVTGSHISNTNSGNVGIGTSNPGQALEINGASNIWINNSFAVGDQTGLYFDASIGKWGVRKIMPSSNSHYLDALFDTTGGAGAHSRGLRVIDAQSSLVRLFVSDTGGVGIGTNAPAARLHVSSPSAAAADTVLLVSTAAVPGAESFVVKGDGRVGVGVTNPLGRLHVSNSEWSSAPLLITGQPGTGKVGPTLTLDGSNAGGGQKWDIISTQDAGLAPGGKLGIFHNGPTGTGYALVIDKTLNTGIGTTSPAARLHVSSENATGSDVLFKVSSGAAASQDILAVTADGTVALGPLGSSAKLSINSGPNATPLRLASSVPGGNAEIVFRNTRSGGAGDSDTAKIYSVNTGTTFDSSQLRVAVMSGIGVYNDRLTFTGPGDIGIGTTSPKARLHVSSANALSSETMLLVSTNAVSPGNEAFVVMGDGKVGIGTAFPTTSSKLHIKGGYLLIDENDLALRTSGLNRWHLRAPSVAGGGGLQVIQMANNAGTTLNQPRLVVADDGEVGIGTANPQASLEVAGTGPILALNTLTGTAVSEGIEFRYGGTTAAFIRKLSSTGDFRIDAGTADMTLFSGGSLSLHLAGSGRVGIGGTAGATARLNVANGDIQLSTTSGPRSALVFSDGSKQDSAGWQFLGGQLLTSPASTLSVNVPNLRHYRIYFRTTGKGATANLVLRFNNSSTGYHWRVVTNGTQNSASADASMRIGPVYAASIAESVVIDVFNTAGKRKMVSASGLTDMAPPDEYRAAGAWDDGGTNTTQISSIQVGGTSGNTVTSGSEVTIFGSYN